MCLANAFADTDSDGDRSAQRYTDIYANSDAYCYRAAEIYAIAQAASHARAPTVRLITR